MPKYEVTVCWEVWKYYRVEVEADNEDYAQSAVAKLTREGKVATGEPDYTDGNGFDIISIERKE